MSTTQYSRRDHPTLRRGSRGDAVVRMQKRLVKHNKQLDEAKFVDGIFGPGTDQQVRMFQRNNHLQLDGVVGRNTWTALLKDPEAKVRSPAGSTARTEDRKQARDEANPAMGGSDLAARVKQALKRKGYKFLDDGKPYHLNIIGVRNPSTAINDFDDRMIIVYRDDSGQEQAVEYPITTDPGAYFTQSKLLNKDGAAILVPGQYNSTYKIAKHRKKYDALCQLGSAVTVWRDGNKDQKLDRAGKKYTGWYGINIHRAGQSGTTEKIGRYSAGCQVHKNADNFAVMMSLAKKSKDIRGNRFSYTLLEEADL